MIQALSVILRSGATRELARSVIDRSAAGGDMRDVAVDAVKAFSYQIATADSFLSTVEDIAGDPHLDLSDTWIRGDSEQ